jgi:superkiller protein 3
VLVFWALWFPTCLLVTTYLIQLGQRVREARMYLSLVGVCAVAAILTLMVWKRLPIRISDTTIGVRSGRRFLTATIVVVVAALGTATVGRNALWSSSLELWGNSARDGGQGTWRAHMNYALALENAGRAEEALVEFKNAVERGPYAWAYLNLGLAQVRRGLAEEGETNLRRAVSLWPDSPETNYYLGVGLMRLGKVDEAEQSFKHSLELRSNYLLAYRSLGQLYEQQGQVEQAIASYQKLVELDPGQAAAVDRIDKLRENGGDVQALAVFREAFAAQRDGRRDETIRLYEDLLKIDPRHRQGNFNLAFAYLDGTTPEDWKRAADLFGRVLEIDPNYTEAAHRLATAYGRLGERDEAVRWDKHYLQGETHPALADLSRRRLAALGESEE